MRILPVMAVMSVYAGVASGHESTQDVRPHPGSAEANNSLFHSTNAATGTLSVRIFSEKGELTPALVGIQHQGTWKWQFVKQSVFENPRHPLQRSQRRQWRTRYPVNVCGTGSIELPVGEYVIHASKGLEYVPAQIHVSIRVNEVATADVRLERFINMSANGWWSGDTHIHASRPDPSANEAIQCAAQAEDIHVANILTMGSPDDLEFLQYGYGSDSTVKTGDYWLVPGQEGPRTNELGHVVMLNTAKLFHEPDNYYDYSTIFRAARDEGVLIGMAHYYEEKFFVERSGALLFPQGLVDFLELIDNLNVLRPDHYYQALNLGFRFPLIAGSDFPWGDHIGDQRTYAFIGEGVELTPAQWYAAIRRGETFVSQGPLIDLKVNGRPIGDTVKASSGDTIRITATATGYPRIGAPKKLWITAMGEELSTASNIERSPLPLTLNIEFKAEKSMWITAATEAHNFSVAHTSPIYLEVDGKEILAEGAKLEEAAQEMINRLQYYRHNELPMEPASREKLEESVTDAIKFYKQLSSVFPEKSHNPADR